MRLALEEAKRGHHLGEVPVGAVVVANGTVIGAGFNQPIHAVDPTAHAEIVALRAAAREIGNYRVTGVSLYATIEPCLMCVGALVHARIGTLVYGTAEPKGGAVISVLDLARLPLNHHFQVIPGILETECRELVVEFFRFRRQDG